MGKWAESLKGKMESFYYCKKNDMSNPSSYLNQPSFKHPPGISNSHLLPSLFYYTFLLLVYSIITYVHVHIAPLLLTGSPSPSVLLKCNVGINNSASYWEALTKWNYMKSQQKKKQNKTKYTQEK